MSEQFTDIIGQIIEYAKQNCLGTKDGDFVPYALLINEKDEVLIMRHDDAPMLFVEQMASKENFDVKMIFANEYIGQAALHGAVYSVLVNEAYSLKADKGIDPHNIGPLKENPGSIEILSVFIESKKKFWCGSFEIKRKNQIAVELEASDLHQMDKEEESDMVKMYRSARYMGILDQDRIDHAKKILEKNKYAFQHAARAYWENNGSIVTYKDLIGTLVKRDSSDQGKH